MSLALDDNWVMHGRLVADGVAQTQIAQCSAHLGVGFTVELAVVAQQWIYQPTVAGKVVKLEAEKSGGTGSSFTRNPDTCISAVWIGP
jgi:hypothetical protein